MPDGASSSPANAPSARPDPDIIAFLDRALPPAQMPWRFTRLTGGVASDIWLVEGDNTFCVKRALAKLRVAADWFAPVARNANEVAWLRCARAIVPGAVPRVLADDAHAGIFAMEYCPPERFHNWKTRLLAGDADAAFSARVGETLARIHAGAAAQPDLRDRFGGDAIFLSIRLEPYFLATARAHPDLAPRFEALVERTLATRHSLVHGDISPKNILVGPEGPVFLDAECAWWGDPAFDLAFCLNHLLLKTVPRRLDAPHYAACFTSLAQNYLTLVNWEDAAALEARAATLLPALLLARIDGKSPVEYIVRESDRDAVRAIARALLTDAPGTLAAIADAWFKNMGKETP